MALPNHRRTGYGTVVMSAEERNAEVLRAVAEHGYLGDGLPLSVAGVGSCGVCMGHSPKWDGHDRGCREWVRSKLAPILDELENLRARNFHVERAVKALSDALAAESARRASLQDRVRRMRMCTVCGSHEDDAWVRLCRNVYSGDSDIFCARAAGHPGQHCNVYLGEGKRLRPYPAGSFIWGPVVASSGEAE